MAIPATTAEYLDLTDAAFTANGSPAVADDQHNAGSTYDPDNVNDYLTSSETPISGSSGANHTVSFWIKYNGILESGYFVAQLSTATSNQRAFQISALVGGELQAQFYTADANNVQSNISAGTDNWDDDTWRLITVVSGTDSVAIYIDGAEASAYNAQDVTAGTGFSGVPATVNNLSVFATENGLAFGSGIVSRIKFWEGTALSAAQVLEEYNAELAARPASIFPDELTSWYNPVWDGSGAPKDKFGTDDMATLTGGTHNSEGILFDGTNDEMISKTKANGVPISVGTDYVLYMRVIVEATIGAVNERWWHPTVLSGTKQGPSMSPLFGVSLGQFRFASHNAAGDARLSLEMGRDFEVGEEVLIVMSQDHSLRKITGAIYSKNSSSPLAMSGEASGTADPGFNSTDSYTMFHNTVGTYSNVTLLEMGAIAGTFKTEDDLNTAGVAWAAVADDTATTSPLISPLIDPAISSLFGSDLFLSS